MQIADAPVIVTRTLRKTEIAVTEIRHDGPEPGMSQDIPYEDAFLVALQMRDYPLHEHWEGGRRVSNSIYQAGETTIYDLKRNPQFEIVDAFHSMHFYIPRNALDGIAEDLNVPRIGDLNYQPGGSVVDQTIQSIGSSLRSAFQRPDQVSRIFMDHVTMAVAAHVAQTYGGLLTTPRPVQGGLAPWQEKRAKDLMTADLTQDISLQEVAQECGVSLSHFSRAFRRSTGLAPYAWLLQCKVEAAKVLLRSGRLSLAEVGLACGFADQSHFTRVFTRHVGVSPGAWRRCVAS